MHNFRQSIKQKISKVMTSRNYYFRLEHGVYFDQVNGCVTYAGRHDGDDVGSIIAQAPFSKTFSYFEIEILNSGQRSTITIGTVPDNYPSNQQPGWREGSIGYHADDGGIYVESGWPQVRKETCQTTDRMGCGIRYIDERQYIYFTKNGHQIVEWPFSGPEQLLYPIVGLHSLGEKARLVGNSTWRSTHDPTDMTNFDDLYQFVLQSNISFCQATGNLSYAVLSTTRDMPVGTIVGKFPFTNWQKYFEIEITNAGQNGYIAVGAVPRNYPPNRQPGWNTNSIGYHADDGGIFVEYGKASQYCATCGVGDRLGCGVTFNPVERRQYVYFTKNGDTVVNIAFGNYTDLLYPAIGLHSAGESTRLTIDALWKKTDVKSSIDMVSVGALSESSGRAAEFVEYEPNSLAAFIADIDREVLECPICMGVLSEPKILPCQQHTFCAKCLENYILIQGGRNIPCPVCRELFIVPPAGVAILKNNLMAERLVQLRRKYL